MSCHPCQGWAGGGTGIPRTPPAPQQTPSTIPHAGCRSLGCLSGSLFTHGPFSSLSLCLASQPSVPKPFQGFQMTIIGEKDCAAFSFQFCFQSQRALRCPLLPTPHSHPVPPSTTINVTSLKGCSPHPHPAGSAKLVPQLQFSLLGSSHSTPSHLGAGN